MNPLVEYFNGQKQAMIDRLTELVEFESFSGDKAMVDRLGQHLQGLFRALNADSVTVMPRETVGDLVLAKWNASAPGKPILALMHIDTVWPTGTLAQRPVRIDEDGRLYGPGAVDMKGGIVVLLTALRGLQELSEMPQRPIWVLMTTDEEIGSKQSEESIKEIAAHCGLVLVMEPATPDGALKTWRKGVASYGLRINGRASHAGNAPEEGVNAIIEFAQQALELNQLNDLKNGTSVSVTMVQGGSAGNVIPAVAEAHIDTRMITMKELERLDKAILNRDAYIPGATISVYKKAFRPPMERMPAAYEQARQIGTALGLTVREEGVGGGSDGNFTAAIGIPTLDGLGPQGDGLHAEHEHVLISTLTQRAALVAGLLRDWQF